MPTAPLPAQLPSMPAGANSAASPVCVYVAHDVAFPSGVVTSARIPVAAPLVATSVAAEALLRLSTFQPARVPVLWASTYATVGGGSVYTNFMAVM